MASKPRVPAPGQLPTLDRFADLLADGIQAEDAAERLGYSRAYGNAMLQRIRKRLGPQAI
jgi:transposase